MKRLRIALLTHSINPRGGVVHCLELAEALIERGHRVSVHAPAAPGARLFRSTRATVELIPDRGSPGDDLRRRVLSRIEAFRQWFAAPGRRAFDVFHAHDGIGANALLALRDDGLVPAYVRTVHHLEESFGDPLLDQMEARSIRAADLLLAVSPSWADRLAERFGRRAVMVGNGVDVRRFRPAADGVDAALRARLGLGPGPVFVAVGGVEARKNTLGILKGFIRLRAALPTAQLVIAGGASLLDHGPYRRRVEDEAAAAGLPVQRPGEAAGVAPAVVLAGVLADADMPALYRLADALVFASLVEGFGLAIVEAMASGTPALVSRRAPFTDFLGDDDCLWVDPHDPADIALAMGRVLLPGLSSALAERGLGVARRHDWASCAARHEAVYRALAALPAPTAGAMPGGESGRCSRKSDFSLFNPRSGVFHA